MKFNLKKIGAVVGTMFATVGTALAEGESAAAQPITITLPAGSGIALDSNATLMNPVQFISSNSSTIVSVLGAALAVAAIFWLVKVIRRAMNRA